MTRREWQQFLDQNAHGLKWANVPQNISLISRKKNYIQKTVTELEWKMKQLLKIGPHCVHVWLTAYTCNLDKT